MKGIDWKDSLNKQPQKTLQMLQMWTPGLYLMNVINSVPKQRNCFWYYDKLISTKILPYLAGTRYTKRRINLVVTASKCRLEQQQKKIEIHKLFYKEKIFSFRQKRSDNASHYYSINFPATKISLEINIYTLLLRLTYIMRFQTNIILYRHRDRKWLFHITERYVTIWKSVAICFSA